MKLSRRSFALSAAAIPAISPLRSFAQSATPASPVSDVQLAEASSRVTTLGRYIPGGVLDEELYFSWVDPERQLFYLASGENDEARSTAFVQSQFGMVPDFFVQIRNIESEMGFGELNVLQAVSSGTPPNLAQIVRLDLNAAELISSWGELGYEERENAHGSFWTIGEEAEFDVNHPIQKMMLAQFNNVTSLDEHTLAFAQTSATLEKVMATVAGDSPNILDGVAPVTGALPETAISAWYVDGSLFAHGPAGVTTPEQIAVIDDQLAESDEATAPMPTIRTIGTGTTQGASWDLAFNDPEAVAYIVLEFDGDAETAAEVIEWRHQNMMSLVGGSPYSEILGEIGIDVVSDSVLRVSSVAGAPHASFDLMVQQRDNLLFTYGN